MLQIQAVGWKRGRPRESDEFSQGYPLAASEVAVQVQLEHPPVNIDTRIHWHKAFFFPLATVESCCLMLDMQVPQALTQARTQCSLLAVPDIKMTAWSEFSALRPLC